ncbi:ABC transporter transmembrane domain-containing protein [uncultured Cohaesibacter sp.]|uniref:peptidase domain-containing ABC transporter n=1 Tax=uncultured Cohaesibacter sp. TaxID=1002546 RepID=UPI00292ED385|nr:ABC transporter transmembrane domain-containing protein [uncultured Cohaesibacter sp.]
MSDDFSDRDTKGAPALKEPGRSHGACTGQNGSPFQSTPTFAAKPIPPAERSNRGKRRSSPMLLKSSLETKKPVESLAEASRMAKDGEINLTELAQFSQDHHLSETPGSEQPQSEVREPQIAEDEPVPFSDFEVRLGIKERWSGIDYRSSAGRCVQVLLALHGWGGGGRHLAQVLPHFNTVHDLTGLRAVLTRLNFVAISDEQRLSSLSVEKLPCLYQDAEGTVRILLSINHADKTINCFNGATGNEETITCNKQPEVVYVIKPLDIANRTRFVQSFGWVMHAASSFRKLFFSLFVINFGINLAAMAVPIFIMSVYGYAIPSKAPSSLIMFLVGIGLVIAADFSLRALRTRILAYIGARFDTALSVEVFQRLLYLPYTMVQNASMGSQLARLRQFEKLREIFLGSFGTAVLDLPFVMVFITAIAIIGGWIAAIPAILVVCYVILAAVTIPIAKRQTMQSGDAKSKKQNIMMELFLMHREIRNVGGEAIWQKRYEDAAASFAALDFRAQHFSRQVQTISQTLSMAAGVSTLGVGTLMVMSGDLGVGGLIAIMALIWRVLAPLQNAFLSLSRVGKLIEAIRMVNNLMRTQPERTPGVIPSISRKFAGHISTKNLSFRYPKAADAAIKSANIVINPGEVVAITGPSGGGKSTLLKLLAGLYRPVAGAVGFDHLDIRQIDLSELRFEISYQPDSATFFYGTVEQNFHLNDPETGREKMQELMDFFNIEPDHPDLPEGLQTRLKAENVHKMTDILKQKLLLCRSFSKKASYYFLDEPANYLDFETDRKFITYLESLRGDATILFTTQRPSHMKIADRILVIHEGQVILNGPPDQVLPQLDAFNKSVA